MFYRFDVAPPGMLPVLLTLFAVAACGVPDASDALDGPEPTRIDLAEPAVRFGSLDDPDAALVPVRGLALASDGSVWASQVQDGEVMVVSHDGVLLRRVGGLGEGPGEFGGIDRLGWLADSLWVADNRNDRITFYSLDGDLLTSTPRPRATVSDDARADFVELVSGGAFFVGGPGVTALTDPATPTRGDDPILVTAREGGEARGIAIRSGTRDRVIVTETAGGEIRSISILLQPWADGSLVATGSFGESLVVVDRPVALDGQEPRYRVTRVTLAGDTLWSTSHAFEPIAIDPARQDSIVAAYAETGPSIETLEERLFLPSTHPPATSVFVGRDGRTWVGREDTPQQARKVWDVFDDDGAFALSFTAPAAVEFLASDAESVWGVETDDLDVPYLVRYDLPRD